MSAEQSNFYSTQDKILIATDCIIFGFDNQSIKLLIFKRIVDPFAGEWSLIGSFVQNNESVTNAAKRVLTEITGLENVFMQQSQVYGAVERDPGARCITVGQYALIRIEDQDIELVEKHGAVWHDLDEMPNLVLDHNQLVEDALSQLRLKASYQPIGFELLPEKFTIPSLQRLYESIYQKKFDDRNFRKKIIALDVLTKLDEKDKSTSKKGAFLYKFNRRKYDRLVEKGINFKL
ncbi:NUDIX domain-containing protein [Flavicella sp.]|uniref:NUDIX hydrolase n=1 Tax=Flavicella sp. TaxID=2957742 RepID=UPI0026364866|nr:NUDIX domain-containing protein [Flavicella sp.]MDG1804375.1 NUDIX domain-containing protein [Flavicella sp.]MDG2279964.1 NUDIX domain-containing protein [Flavicella sp.]